MKLDRMNMESASYTADPGQEFYPVQTEQGPIAPRDPEYLPPEGEVRHSYQEIKIRHPLSAFFRFLISAVCFIISSYFFYLFYHTPDYAVPGLIWLVVFLITLLSGCFVVIDHVHPRRDGWLKNVEKLIISDQGIYCINSAGGPGHRFPWYDITAVSWHYRTSSGVIGLAGGIPFSFPIPEKYRAHTLMGVEITLYDGQGYYIPTSRLSRGDWVRLELILQRRITIPERIPLPF